MTTSEIKWPNWRDVAAGEPSELGRMVSWPLPSASRPQLAQHQKNRPRRLIRVVVNSIRSSIAGYLCEKGVNYLLVYEHELPQIQALVATDRDREAMAEARQAFEIEVAEFSKSCTPQLHNGWATAMETARNTIGISPEALLRQRFKRSTGYPKLERLDVHPDVVPQPETAESLIEQRAQSSAETMGRAIAIALRENESKQKKSA